jgi:tRNA (cmo5U34)-methyltransferase
MSQLIAPFSDPDAVARYAEGPPRFVPGFADLHRMATILMSERVGEDARVLVLGAGGGLELNAFAKAWPGWTFDGVDPAPEMLKLAQRTLGPDALRARLHEGYIDVAPEGPFDAATCLLTLHFLDRAERLRTAREVQRRLKPGAPFVVAHSSFPQAGDERGRWLARYAAFALGSGADPAHVAKMKDAVEAHLNLMNPEDDEALLREAGFTGVTMFYAAFTWRGWVAYA